MSSHTDKKEHEQINQTGGGFSNTIIWIIVALLVLLVLIVVFLWWRGRNRGQGQLRPAEVPQPYRLGHGTKSTIDMSDAYVGDVLVRGGPPEPSRVAPRRPATAHQYGQMPTGQMPPTPPQYTKVPTAPHYTSLTPVSDYYYTPNIGQSPIYGRTT